MATIRILRQCDSQPSKIQAIKLVRAISNMGLKEAKDAVELLPTEVEIINLTSPYGSVITPESVVSELRGYGYEAIVNGGTTLNVETAFKNFLIALINAGEYDQVITFIKTQRHGTIAGGPNRNLEIM